jgi:hypothetical protein
MFPKSNANLIQSPTSLLKNCASVLISVITKIINLSLSTGNFPMAFEQSLVTLHLRKAKRDKGNLSNYHLISNLSFLSKLTDRIKKIPDPSIRLSTYSSSHTVTSDSNVRKLGITFHPHFSNQISNLSCSCFMHVLRPPPHPAHARLHNCLHHCYIHCPLKARLLQFPLPQP